MASGTTLDETTTEPFAAVTLAAPITAATVPAAFPFLALELPFGPDFEDSCLGPDWVGAAALLV